jgi:hypothetical protein
MRGRTRHRALCGVLLSCLAHVASSQVSCPVGTYGSIELSTLGLGKASGIYTQKQSLCTDRHVYQRGTSGAYIFYKDGRWKSGSGSCSGGSSYMSEVTSAILIWNVSTTWSFGVTVTPSQPSCQNCPANSVTSATGQTVISACLCALGYTGPDGEACTACVAGKYKTDPGSAGCTDCLANSYHALTGRTAASACQCNAGTRVGVACACACPACPACPACLVCLVLRHCRSAYFRRAGHALPRRHRRQIHAVLHGVFVSRTDCIISNRIMYSWTTG